MKRRYALFLLLSAMIATVYGQDLKLKDVPVAVQSAPAKRYPEAAKIGWEKEKGNYEANWRGKSGEENLVTFTPQGIFVEIVKAIPVSELPAAVVPYIAAHYNGAKIKEAGKVTDAAGKTSYEAEVKGSDLIFDGNGKFVKKD